MTYNWMPYPNENDISKELPVKGTSSCQYHQVSKLIRNLTFEDSERTYKCEVIANNNQGSSSAQYLLGSIVDPGNLFKIHLKIFLTTSHFFIKIDCGKICLLCKFQHLTSVC